MTRLISMAVNIYIFVAVATVADCKANGNVCSTPACKRIGSSIKNNMDIKADRCDDFYEFACGNSMKNEIIPDGAQMMTPMSQIQEKILKQLKFYIEKRNLSPLEKIVDQMKNFIDKNVNKKAPSYLDKFSLYYKSCMNQGKMEKTEKVHAMKLINKLGGWPVLNESWNEDHFDWIETMYAFRDEGLKHDAFIQVFYVPDIRNNTLSIGLDESHLSSNLPPEVLIHGTSHPLVQRYFNFMVDIAVALGASRTRAKAELAESLNFEIEMARILKPINLKQDLNTLYNPMAIDGLYKNYNECPVAWETYLMKILKTPAKLSLSDQVIVHVPEYLTLFCNLLKKNKSKRILANYALWSVVSHFTHSLGPKARQITKDWHSVLGRHSNEKEKWKECVMSAKNKMPLAAGALYVQKIYGKNIKETRKGASEMVNLIRQELEKSLQKEGWMDKSTKTKAMKKLKKMTSSVAFPNELLDDRKLNEVYKNLTIDAKSFLKSSLTLNRFYWSFQARGYKKPIVKNSWRSLFGDPSTANAFYVPLDNTFMLLAGLLQEPFFNTAYPKYINYAGIGSVIGHEMSHGFDVNGRRFDENGTFSDWWDDVTEAIFMEKAGCFVRQYNDYGMAKNISIDSQRTLAENLADNVGLKQTYAAYSRWVKDNPYKEPRLAGLEQFTPQQMFWLSYANSHCTKIRPGLPPAVQMMDQHAPGHLRVLATLSNIPEFARDFNCPVGSFMNQPNETCSIW